MGWSTFKFYSKVIRLQFNLDFHFVLINLIKLKPQIFSYDSEHYWCKPYLENILMEYYIDTAAVMQK